jgi:uncharacterized protein
MPFDSGLGETYHARAMGNPLLDRASPRDLAERGQVVEKEEELELFPRLTEAVAADLETLSADRLPRQWRQSPVAFRLAFGWADHRQRVPALRGSVTAKLPAVCQRCLEPLTLSLAQELKLLLTSPEGPRATGDEFEIWEIDGPVIRPADIVDEVLIMAMPLAPVHADRRDCGPLAERLAPDRAAAGDTARPFADLRARLRQED